MVPAISLTMRASRRERRVATQFVRMVRTDACKASTFCCSTLSGSFVLLGLLAVFFRM